MLPLRARCHLVPRLVRPKEWPPLFAAEEAGFDLFITADQELICRQNLTGPRIALTDILKIYSPPIQQLPKVTLFPLSSHC